MTGTSKDKRGAGRYFTVNNPFNHAAFKSWANAANLPNSQILEPFAGCNGLIGFLQEMDLCNGFSSFDAAPANKHVKARDTLASFPTGFDVCVTNPPWLAKNSATARGLPFPQCQFDDIYKFALEKCLAHCGYVAALVPESFIRANLFQERLTDFISLSGRFFTDTGHPVGLALFGPGSAGTAVVWSDRKKIGSLSELEAKRPTPALDGPQIRFNDPDGNVGLIALDNAQRASIRFCDVMELSDYTVKPSGRHITKFRTSGAVRIDDWNDLLDRFRQETWDVLMTSYKGIRKDGRYRRRLDWGLARGIVSQA